MKSNVNDAQLIAETYAAQRRGEPTEVIEEFLPAVAAAARVAGGFAAKKLAPAAKKVAKKIGSAAVTAGKEVGKEALAIAGEVGAEAGKVAVDAAGNVVSKIGRAIGAEDGEHGTDDGECESCGGLGCEDCNGSGLESTRQFVNRMEEDQENSCGYDQVLEPEVPEVNVVDESEMHVALSDLHKASKYAAELTLLLSNVGSLEGWTAVKIAKAADYLGAVYHQLDYDLNGHSVHNTGYEDAHEDGEY